MSICPGCGLDLPDDDTASYDGYYHTSPECWSLYSQVMTDEYENDTLYEQCHQLTVDAYAVQHAGGEHPDASVGLHLTGLHLVLEAGVEPGNVPQHYQTLSEVVDPWPGFAPPRMPDDLLTIRDVAEAETPTEHATRSREWAGSLWEAWSPYHDVVASLVTMHLTAS